MGESPAKKILLPINRSGLTIVGVQAEPVPHQIEHLVDAVEEMYFKKHGKGAE